jgi:hypothetical protein
VAGSLPAGDGATALLRGDREAGRCEDRAKTSINELCARERTFVSRSNNPPTDIAKMRVAGASPSELLDLPDAARPAGDHDGELDRLAHDYMVNVQQVDSGDAQLRAARHTPYRRRSARRSIMSCATASRRQEV